MGKPVKHRNRWRIRWVDENGQRRSESYDSREHAEVMLKRHRLAAPPRFKIPRVPHNSADYSYLRTEGEIQRFLTAAREESEGVGILYQCAVYTGMRAGELAGLRREDIDLDHNIITVQHSYDGPTKSGKIRRIPIFDVLRPSLTEWLLKVAGLPVVFPNEAGKMHGPSARVFQETLQGVLDSAEFPLIKRRGKERHYVRLTGYPSLRVITTCASTLMPAVETGELLKPKSRRQSALSQGEYARPRITATP